jgi:hypothetical protein
MMVERFNVERITLIYCSFLKTESTSECRREFRQNVPDVNMPASSAIHNIVKTKTTGPVLNKEIQRRRHFDRGTLEELDIKKIITKISEAGLQR